MFNKLFTKKTNPQQGDTCEGKTVFFLHIPKTAGATLRRIVYKNYPESAVYNLNPNASTTEHHFQNLPAAEKQRFDFVQGHFYYGLHLFHPRPATYITLLRDPVDRILSHYYYVLKTPIHYLHQRVTSTKMTLQEYVTSGITDELDNGQLRLLTGVKGVPIGQCSRNMLEAAKDNLLNHFSLVGVSERFDDFLGATQEVLKWKSSPYENVNVNESRRSKTDVPEETLRVIREANQFDIELYEFVLQTFDNSGRRRS